MPKAVLVAPQSLPLVSAESGWPEGHLDDLDPRRDYFYVQDVQFPHGHIAHAIITRETFHATFKHIAPLKNLFELEEVDYI